MGILVSTIAVEHQVSERQVFRILSKPDVKEVVDRAAREFTRTATLVVQRGAASAATALVGMASGAQPATAPRVAAAGKVLEVASHAVELDDLARRVEELEALVDARERQPR